MTNIEGNKNSSHEISTSESDLNDKEKDNQKAKNEKLTIEDLTEIISEPYQENNKHEKEEKSNKNEIENLSRDESFENELEIIKKKNLSKYVMFDNKFISNNASDENITNSINIIKPTKRKLYKFVGRTLFIFLDKYENPLLIIGPHWPMYVCFCGIISILFLAIYLTLWKQIGFLMQIIGHICFWTYFISYAHCSLFNPGYPKNDIGRLNGLPRDQYYFCSMCHFYVKKDKYAHHCFQCDICIEKHDHHCPWTGHCIGKNNMISFFIFIGSSIFIIIFLGAAICIGASKYN